MKLISMNPKIIHRPENAHNPEGWRESIFTPWVCEKCKYIQKAPNRYKEGDEQDEFSVHGTLVLCGICIQELNKKLQSTVRAFMKKK